MKSSTEPIKSALFLLLCFSAACGFSGSTRLCDNFRSYESLTDVRAQLNSTNLSSQTWVEKSQGTGPSDKREPYKLTYLSGPYKLSGIDGVLRFTFYNGKLMETEFRPEISWDYLKLRDKIPDMPPKPSEEVITDRRTRFRFDVSPKGEVSLTWYDPKLEQQWKNWVIKNG